MRGHAWPCGIDRVAAPLARRSAGGDDPVGVIAERVGLAAGDVEADVAAIASAPAVGGARRRTRRRRLEVGVEQLLELHEQAVVDAVVAEADRTEHEGVVGSDAEVGLAEHRAVLRRRQVVEDVAQPRRDGFDLQLLAAHRHPLAAVAGAEVEDPRARARRWRWPRTRRPRRTRRRRCSWRSPATRRVAQLAPACTSGRIADFLMTASAPSAGGRSSSPTSTIGLPARKASTLTDAGLMTMRWNRSRWVPIGVGDRRLDRVGVRHAHDRPAGMGRRAAVRSSRRCAAASRRSSRRRESGTTTGRAAPSPTPASSSASPALAGPLAEVALDQAAVDLGAVCPVAAAIGAAVCRARSSDDV